MSINHILFFLLSSWLFPQGQFQVQAAMTALTYNFECQIQNSQQDVIKFSFANKDQEWVETSGDKLGSDGVAYKLRTLARGVMVEASSKIQFLSQLTLEKDGKIQATYIFSPMLTQNEAEFEKNFPLSRGTQKEKFKDRTDITLKCKVSL